MRNYDVMQDAPLINRLGVVTDDCAVRIGNMVAVRTKFLGPTNTLGARVRVWRADMIYQNDPCSLTVSWDDAWTVDQNHAAAVAVYVQNHANQGHLSWVGDWELGGSDATGGYVAVKRQ